MLTIKYIKKADSFMRNEGTEYAIRNYLTKDISPKVSLAISELSGDTPTNMNLVSDRVYYFIEADAKFIFDDQTIEVETDSVLFVPANTNYKMSGRFRAVLINAPGFDVTTEVFGK